MHAMIVKRLGAAVSAVVLSAGLAACGGGDSFTGPGDDWQPASWEAAIGMTSGEPGSVYIHAKRYKDAHDLYPCLNEDYICLNFDEYGDLVPRTDEGPDAPGRFERLCPSKDYPHSDWKFSYTVYSKPNCDGTPLNTAANNLVCFDVDELDNYDRNENYTREWLDVGPNENHVLCLSRNSHKEWDFTICEDLTPPDADYREYCNGPDEPDVLLDCGCYPARYEDASTLAASTSGRQGPKKPIKDILCHFWPRLPFCDDNPPEYPEEPEFDYCHCDFDVTTLPYGCMPVLDGHGDCNISCGNYD